jgi:hypothetical protein
LNNKSVSFPEDSILDSQVTYVVIIRAGHPTISQKSPVNLLVLLWLILCISSKQGQQESISGTKTPQYEENILKPEGDRHSKNDDICVTKEEERNTISYNLENL